MKNVFFGLVSRPLIVLFFGIFLIACRGQVELTEETRQQIQQRVAHDINPGIVVGIIDANGVRYHSFGRKSVTGGEPVDEYSVFEIGSISKTFTGIILADKVLKGEVKLEDRLQELVPPGVEAPTRNGQSIKLIHLANHTSALPRLPANFNPANPANPYADYTEEQLYDFLDTYVLTRDIGSQYEYSNYAMGLLGHVLASRANKTYETMLSDAICEPLGLGNTRVVLTPEMRRNLAIGHSAGMEVENWDLPVLAGAGGIRSNTVDMVNYLAANMGSQETALYPAMQLSHKNSRRPGDTPEVGLGWHIMDLGDMDIIWHNGGTGGYRTFIGFERGGDTGVVVMSNSDAGIDDIGIHLLHPESPLQPVKPSIATELRKIIDSKGLQDGVVRYQELRKEEAGAYNFSENELARLAHRYLTDGEMDKALGVYDLNKSAYPNSSRVYQDYAEALLVMGDTLKAIDNYKKSVTYNPGNQTSIKVLNERGVNTDILIEDVVVDLKVLDTYLGSYELSPGFILTVSRDGRQMEAQATGQPKFQIFPQSENVFYLKVVEAQLTFNRNESGKVISVTLLQGGQEIVGPKMPK
jgi:CubicO group peptidase (beta-lactamase class C family)